MSNDRASASIGIFDSGFGGLTVMRAIRELLPQENIVYLGDTARLPYGSKSAATIAKYSLENASFLIDKGIKVLVVACHTACAAALDELRNTLDIPIIGILEQGIEELLRSTKSGQIALLGTRATISSGIYQKRIMERLPDAKLSTVSCPMFVPLIEEGYINHAMAELVTREYLLPLKNQGIDSVLLGCTHYPLLRALIQQELGPEISLIDPAGYCAERIKDLLQSLSLINEATSAPSYQFFVTDDPEKFRLLGKTFLDHPIDHVEQKHI